MTCIDLDNLNEEGIYEAFDVDGNESEALNDSYLELYELKKHYILDILDM